MTRVGRALVVALLVCASPLFAQERIISLNSEVDVRADGSLDVTEHITVRAEGRQIRRGIYRDFPTRYRDRYGNRVVVDFEMVGVERNGAPEAWFTERVSNGVRINTGGDDFLPVPAEYTFTLRYRTTRQLGFFDRHDELYWNAIGTGWSFRIESGSVEVRLPAPVPVEQMSAEGYTGFQGERGSAYVAELAAPGVARYRLTQPLLPEQGFTIVLTFPKGLVPQPTSNQRIRWFFTDNSGVLLAFGGLLMMLTYCGVVWRRVGRDPSPGVIIPRYAPSGGHTPAGLRYLRRMRYDERCFSGDLLALAVAGHLRIDQTRKFLRDEWSLTRTPALAGAPPMGPQQELLYHLFPPGATTLVLRNTNATTVSGANSAHRKALDREFHPRFFKRNAGYAFIAFVIAAASIAAAVITSGGFGIPAIAVIGVVMLVTNGVFGSLVRAPTKEGRKLLDEIEGLKLYLGVAERDELARMRGPAEPPLLDAERYEALLPYAVALDVEDAWTKKFTAAVGAAAAAEAAAGMRWYSGSRPVSNMGAFSKALGSSLSSTISSSSRPPGSSSGSGGGGSSGGGGGGGGGGGR